MLIICSFILFSIFTFGNISAQVLRIVGGSDTLAEEIPYQVSLQTNFSHYCGGVIIHNYFVLSAAHCVTGKDKKDIQIISGTIDVDDRTHVNYVNWMLAHPKFNAEDRHNHENDIGIIKVSEPFLFEESISAAVLPRPHLVIRKRTKLTASGWGSMKGAELTLPKILQKVRVTVIDKASCKRLYNGTQDIYPTQICTQDILTSKRKGVCIGDSGGPVVARNDILVAIISWSHKDPDCASPLYPDVHTRVAEYIDWIKDTMRLE